MNWTILVPLGLLCVVHVESRFWSKSDTGPYAFECKMDPSQEGCKGKFRLQNHVSPDGDEKPLPIPATISERIKTYCKNDPESQHCIDLGLGKTKKRRLSDDEISNDDEAVTRESEEIEDDEEEEMYIEEYDTDRSGEEEEEGKIDCEETPGHAGCMRNEYLDQFIAWKIEKDCEVNQDGPFCPKTLSKGCEKAPETSTPSPESPELSEFQKNTTRFIHKLLDEIRRDPASQRSEMLLPFLKLAMEALRNHQNPSKPSESSTESPATTSTTSAPESEPEAPKRVNILDLLREIFHVSKNATSSSEPSGAPESTDLGNLIRQILTSNGDPDTILSILKDYWNLLKKEIDAEKAQKPGKYAPEVTQEYYIGEDAGSHVDSEEKDAKPIASYTGVIPDRSKSFLNFY